MSTSKDPLDTIYKKGAIFNTTFLSAIITELDTALYEINGLSTQKEILTKSVISLANDVQKMKEGDDINCINSINAIIEKINNRIKIIEMLEANVDYPEIKLLLQDIYSKIVEHRKIKPHEIF